MTATTAAKELLNDLLTLEVNVIVKPGMTARKMPDLPHALLDIFSTYDLWLCEKAGLLNPLWARFRATPQARILASDPPENTRLVRDGALIDELESTPLYSEQARINADTFDELRNRSRTAEEMHRQLVARGFSIDDGMEVIAKRIYRNCDQMKGILEGRQVAAGTRKDQAARKESLSAIEKKGISRKDAAAGDLPLTADEVLVVRKAWEVGTETVVMQTVAQLDGDVITRIQQARLATAEAPLYELHRQAVATALEHWQFLVQTFVQLTTRVAGFLAP